MKYRNSIEKGIIVESWAKVVDHSYPIKTGETPDIEAAVLFVNEQLIKRGLGPNERNMVIEAIFIPGTVNDLGKRRNIIALPSSQLS